MAIDVLKNDSIMNFEFKIAKREPVHFHQNIEIFYVLEGQVKLSVDDQSFEMNAEDVLIINSNKKHSYMASGDTLIGSFQVDYAMLTSIMKSSQVLFWCNSVINKTSAFEEIRSIMKTIFNQYFDKDPQSQVYVQSLYYQLLKSILENFLIRNDDQRFLAEKNTDEDRLVEILNYIRMNYKKRLSLNELASQLYLSVPYLSKYIKRHLGMNFMEYLNNVRLFHAVDDLLYTDNSITNIAIDNGFANTASFNELFKKAYDQTPSEYRKLMKENSMDVAVLSENPEKVEERVSAYLDSNAAQYKTYEVGNHEYTFMNVLDKQEYHQHWKQMINVGRAGDLLRSDMQEHLIILKNELGFRYVRIWDIFSKEIMIDENNAEGNYNFEKIDKVLDFLVENKMIPFIEMGYKPRELHRTIGDQIISEERENPFVSLRQVKRFFKAFARHLLNRYGMAELEKWIFEQWSGENFRMEVSEYRFFTVFEALYEAFKTLSPKIKVGGGGMGIQSGSENLTKLVKSWESWNYRPDFISLYCYPYVAGDIDGFAYARLSSDKDFLRNQLLMIKESLHKTEFKEVPIYVSEWSSTISNRNLLNDTCYKSAYIVKSVIDSLGQADVLGYWVGSDIFAEYYDSKNILFGGCGLLTKDAIKKPSFYAYRLLSFLSKYLVGKDEHSIITSDGRDNYSIVCHNYRHLNYKYYLKREDEITLEKMVSIFQDYEMFEIDYQLSGVKNGRYRIKEYSVHPEEGCVLAEWKHMGYGSELSKSEVNYLKRICTPRIHIKEYEANASVLNFKVRMKPHEILALEITYLYE